MSLHEHSNVPGSMPDPPRSMRGGAPLEALLDVSMPVTIEVGRTRMTVQEILEIAPGTVIELDRAVGEPVDVYVSDRLIAHGEVVVVDEHFGVRVTHIVSDASEVAG